MNNIKSENIIILLISSVFLIELIWFLTDPRPIKERFKGYLSFKTLSIYIIELSIIILPILNALFFPILNTPYNYIIIGFGLLIFYLGESIAIWAKLIMKNIWRPATEYNFQQQNKLITSGPFSFSRNPIYLGMLLMCFGFSIALRSYFVFLGFILILVLRNIAIKEEKKLEKHFGKDYLKYKEKVPRFLF